MNPQPRVSVYVPARRSLPRGLSAKARNLAELFAADAPTHMWDLLDDAALANLLETMAKALEAAPAGQSWCWAVTPPGQGMTHLLVQAPHQPFLTDTVAMAARRVGATMLGLAHPLREGGKKTASPAMLVYVAVEALDAAAEKKLLAELERVITLAKAVVEDFPEIVGKVQTILTGADPRTHAPEQAFLRWLLDGHFIFLGYRRYRFASKGRDTTIQVRSDSGLGILRTALAHSAVSQPTLLSRLGGSLPQYLADEGWLQLSKTPDISAIHRPVAMDYVGIIERDDTGAPLREHRFIGLYTSQAYTRSVRDIPLLREKIDTVLAASRWPQGSDNHRALVNVLETFPRDELFMVNSGELLLLGEAMVLARKQLADVAVMVRPSPREQAVTVYMLAPMSRYNSFVRDRVRALLMEQLDGLGSSYKVEMSDGDLARILFKVRVNTMPTPKQEADLAEQVRMLVRGWHDKVRLALKESMGAVAGERYGSLLDKAFSSAAYQEVTPVDTAVDDAAAIARLVDNADEMLGVRLCHRDGMVDVRLVTRATPLELGEVMPVVRAFGLEAVREQSFEMTTAEGTFWLHVFSCKQPAVALVPDAARGIEQAMAECLAGSRISDSLNSLLLHGLPLAATDVLRAMTAYLQQAGQRFVPGFTRKVLREHPEFAGHVWEVFAARHNPQLDEAGRSRTLRGLARREKALLDALPDADYDRTGRAVLAVVDATLRTNLWQGKGAPLAFKVDSTKLALLPQPRPWREIFIFATEVEGIHLRGGPVARGGLRHSDRLSDYRTEVLGLQTAQMRKNTIIVPEGAKGGFVVKKALPADRAAAQVFVRACYRRYILALLSLTDTRIGSKVVAPQGVVCHDGNDPYLVVAADKGTATFSDLANATALEADFWKAPRGMAKPNGFWLGDAFASGGEHGYDHKEMAITARGAWISVLHHARGLEIEPSAKRPFTMVGIGDMGGDVFGNGLLMDKHVKLLAAFNHKHVFLDPNPDPATSYAERQRMFKAGLGWDGYTASKISKGGGVYGRHDKRIVLSKEAQAMLGLKKAEATPVDVIRAILCAKVDCLWNGGIGTYIKAGAESHADAADRANDDLRVDAAHVQARIIGEGGNLGITADGRVELALHGVRLNTDAVDNSAGVSASDHEVNLKILFAEAMQAGKLAMADRNRLLPKLTDTVAELVLHDNALQNTVLSAEEAGDVAHHRDLLRWQQELLRRGHVDMAVDTLPGAEVLKQRSHHRYTRPELASMLAGTKAALRAQIAGRLDYDGPLMQRLLVNYFPTAVRKDFATWIPSHPLAHEIIDTVVANMVVNRCGLLMGQHLQADFSCTPEDAIKAILVAIGLLDALDIWQQMDDADLPVATQIAAGARIRTTLTTLAGWVLGHGMPVDQKGWMEKLQVSCHKAFASLKTMLPEQTRTETESWQAEWQQRGVPARLAGRLALLSACSVVPQAMLMALNGKQSPAKVLKLHLAIGEALQLPAVMRHIRAMQGADRWQRPAVQTMMREIMARQVRLTECLLHRKEDADNWLVACGNKCQRYHTLAKEFLRAREPGMGLLTVLLGRLRELED